MNVIVLENIRSAYNVGNIIRTADALGWGVILSGYTPSPFSEEKVVKTSLWAEKSVFIKEFWNMQDTINYLKGEWYYLIASEIADGAIALNQIWFLDKPLALIMGNEIEGISKQTLMQTDQIVFIPMKGHKESLNVWQAAAIGMWEFSKKCWKMIS